jgi:hypothetical protein
MISTKNFDRISMHSKHCRLKPGTVLSTPDLISEQRAMDFPLDAFRRRWYDLDPILWLMFNALSSAPSELLDEVAEILDQEIS